MDLIVFLPPTQEPSVDANLLDLVRQLWRMGRVEHHASLEALGARLGRPRPEPFHLLLCPAHAADLDRLVAMRDLLAESPTICLLPDNLPHTLARGHLLHPRLVIPRQGAEEIIAQVLRNFQNRDKSN